MNLEGVFVENSAKASQLEIWLSCSAENEVSVQNHKQRD